MTTPRRQTITVNPALATVLASGICCPGQSLGSRIETLAGRYMALITDPTLLPANWPVDAWAAVIRAVRVIDTRIPTAPYSLSGYLRANKPHPKVVYASDSLTQASLHAIIALGERAHDVPLDNADALSAFLRQAGVRIEGG